jgi:hypothetical protein
MKKIDRLYESEADKFLKSFDTQPGATSPSRRQEESKYKDVNKRRDEVVEDQGTPIWKGF